MELVGRVAFEAARLRPFLPTYLHLLASALFPIYVGAHASLSIPSSAAPPAKKKQGARRDDFTDEPEVIADKVEGLTPRDAILFPLVAGFTLSSLYFIIKWLEDPSILNKVLSYYFMQVGLVFGTKFLKDALTVFRSVSLPNQYAQGGLVWRVNRLKHRYEADDAKSDAQAYRLSPLPGWLHRLTISKSMKNRLWRIRELLYAKCSLNFHLHKFVTIKVPVDILDALAISTSLGIVGFFTFLHKPWYISNLLGFAFCYGSTQYMSPTTFWTGTLLLSALFLYDIYFVFFTPMMVTVATKLDIPIKLLFPRPPSPAEAEKGLKGLAMLGLGDIVIPGMMIALALRFDLYLHYLRKSKKIDGRTEKATYVPVTGGWGERFWVGRSAAGSDLRAKAFHKTYFKAGLTGYAFGMIATLLVMQIAEHAQPALLYLVPGVLGALWGTATVKGDLNQMWRYTEDKEADKEKDTNQKKDNRKKDADAEIEEKAEERKTTGSDEAASRAESSFQNDDPLSTSTTTEEGSEVTPNTDDNSETTSESLSESGSDTKLSSQSERRELEKPKVREMSKKAEKECRHLIWFSIDFPPTPASIEESGPTKHNQSEQAKDNKEPTSRTLNGKDREPPGKRRRVR
jgi:minor histocompatibility antigen H13